MVRVSILAEPLLKPYAIINSDFYCSVGEIVFDFIDKVMADTDLFQVVIDNATPAHVRSILNIDCNDRAPYFLTRHNYFCYPED